MIETIPTRLCWFCGEAIQNDESVGGDSIIEMAYGSFIRFGAMKHSDDYLVEVKKHVHSGRSCICIECLRSCLERSANINGLQNHLAEKAKNLLLHEMADYETGLIEWHERQFLPACWFGDYPCMGGERFWSLNILELFTRGWRLEGKVKLESSCLDCLLMRFSDGLRFNSSSQQVYVEAVDHLRARITPFDIRLLNVRACIYCQTCQDIVKRLPTDNDRRTKKILSRKE